MTTQNNGTQTPIRLFNDYRKASLMLMGEHMHTQECTQKPHHNSILHRPVHKFLNQSKPTVIAAIKYRMTLQDAYMPLSKPPNFA